MRTTLLFLGGLCWLACATAPAFAQSPPATDLTLPQALELALAHNPELAAAAAEVEVRAGNHRQAGLRPNPELALEVENFAGQEELRGTESAETTLQLSQLVELGGKRGRRLQLAGREEAMADGELAVQRLELISATRKAFVQLLAAQQGLALAEEQVRLAEGVFATVEARVSGGKVPAVERQRAEVDLAVARSGAVQAGLALAEARQSLALQWGGDEPWTPKAVGTLDGFPTLPALATLTARLDQAPEAARWQQEAAASQARIALARASAVPDLTLSVGLRQFQQNDDTAMVAGLSLPLPLFDRNQGEIAAAGAALNQSRHRQQAALARSRAALANGHAALVAAQGQARILREQVLPAAQGAFEAAELGYQVGKFDYLSVLDAQRTLFEVRGQYLEALTAAQLALVELDRLAPAPQP
jgi:outer membrane protein, heavy metal efflux system